MSIIYGKPIGLGGTTGMPVVINVESGSEVTATNGSKTKTGLSVDGQCILKLPEAGMWQFFATLNDKTTTIISQEYISNIQLQYFTAIINVIYPTGATCSCSDGTTTLTATNTSGSYSFMVPNTGTWTISAIKPGGSTNASVIITSNGETKSVSLNFTTVVKSSPTTGIEYTNGISTLTPEILSLCAKAISNTTFNHRTTTLYIDYINNDTSIKISCGDQVSINLGGTDYKFDIIGFNHDTLTNSTAYGNATISGKAGITLQMHNCYNQAYRMNASNTQSGYWVNSEMHTSTMKDMKNRLPSAWQNIIKNVNKSCGQKTTVADVENSLFLLSEVEVFNNVVYASATEGTQYQYYAIGYPKQKYDYNDSSLVKQWLRSMDSASSSYWCGINANGDAGGDLATVQRYIACAFSI